jgi:ubiquinone/menaquinone biosynthesis C-methylase UbiE
MASDSERPAPSRDAFYDALARTVALDRLRHESYGDDYIPDLKASSMIMLSELRWCAEALQLARGDTLMDLGCGLGGPGLWLARETGATVTGVDLASVGLRYAQARSASFVGGGRANYLVADAVRLPMRTGSFQAAVGIDVFQGLPDKELVLAEVRRVLRPGGRFVFTTRERRSPDSPGLPDRIVADHAPLLRSAGFHLIRCHEPPGWEQRHRQYYLRVLEMRDAIRARRAKIWSILWFATPRRCSRRLTGRGGC